MTAIATEKEVKAAMEKSYEDDKPTPELLEWFVQYMDTRRSFDSTFKAWADTEDLEEAAEEDDLDWYGDSVEYQWTETGRCGDTDYFRVEFPTRHLWMDKADWKAEVQEKDRLEKERKAREKREREERQRKAQEERERKQLRILMLKYPEEVTDPYVPGSLG